MKTTKENVTDSEYKFIKVVSVVAIVVVAVGSTIAGFFIGKSA